MAAVPSCKLARKLAPAFGPVLSDRHLGAHSRQQLKVQLSDSNACGSSGSSKNKQHALFDTNMPAR